MVKMDLRDFTNELSIDSPAPGGGSVAALAGALASALASMVANLTIGKKGYEDVREKMIDTAVNAQRIKDELLKSIDRDTAAFNELMGAFRLPKKSEEEIAIRNDEIENATRKATNIPFEVMKTSVDALKLIQPIAQYGNINAMSDAGVAALMGLSSVKGAGLNVRINLPSVQDNSFKETMTKEMTNLIQQAQSLYDTIMNIVDERME